MSEKEDKLKQIGQAIRDGDTTVDQAFRPSKKEEQITVDELKKLLKEKEGALDKQEFDSARRIIDNNEVDSFKKLKDILNSIYMKHSYPQSRETKRTARIMIILAVVSSIIGVSLAYLHCKMAQQNCVEIKK